MSRLQHRLGETDGTTLVSYLSGIESSYDSFVAGGLMRQLGLFCIRVT
jgi:hypothetical protein